MSKLVGPQFTRRVNPTLYSREPVPGFSAVSSAYSDDYFVKNYAFHYRPEHCLLVQFEKIGGNIYSSTGLVAAAGQTVTIELFRHGGQGNSDWRIVILE
jgi:hypothetical protein